MSSFVSSPGDIPHYWHITSGHLHYWLVFIPIASCITLKEYAHRLSNSATRYLALQAYLQNLVEASMDPHLLGSLCLPTQNHVANSKTCYHLNIYSQAPPNHHYTGIWVAGHHEINRGKQNPKSFKLVYISDIPWGRICGESLRYPLNILPTRCWKAWGFLVVWMSLAEITSLGLWFPLVFCSQTMFKICPLCCLLMILTVIWVEAVNKTHIVALHTALHWKFVQLIYEFISFKCKRKVLGYGQSGRNFVLFSKTWMLCTCFPVNFALPFCLRFLFWSRISCSPDWPHTY